MFVGWLGGCSKRRWGDGYGSIDPDATPVPFTLRTKCVETESGSLCVTPAACRAAEMASDVRMPPLGASPKDHLCGARGGGGCMNGGRAHQCMRRRVNQSKSNRSFQALNSLVADVAPEAAAAAAALVQLPTSTTTITTTLALEQRLQGHGRVELERAAPRPEAPRWAGRPRPVRSDVVGPIGVV